MSAGFPYLQRLRKSELVEFAERSALSDFRHMRKTELESAVDDHLTSHRNVYQGDKFFQDYYKRLETSSPIKTEMPERKSTRKRSKAPDDSATASGTMSFVSSKVSSMMRTPSRSSLSVPASVPLPPSPAVVTDAIDRQTAKIRRRVSGLLVESGLEEKSDSFRHLLSSSVAISVIALAVEGYSLRKEILPSRVVGFLPAIPAVIDEKTPVWLPDMFMLLHQSFWAPFSLWIMTSFVLPLCCAYFINLPMKSHAQHQQSTRRHSAAATNEAFDPVVYNLAKAFTSYIVYAQHCNLFGVFQHFTIATVKEAFLGGHQGVLIGTALGGILGLYEAILTR